ncbi:MAG: hypothetical protein P8Q41_00370 [Saprospiraceae bacterium]|jgi:hypothetical protein|nr:hypothetical protein [Saprospiraceae bacterium]
MKKNQLFVFLILCTINLQSQTLSTIESVEYDALQNRFFISNADNIIARASNGDLSIFGSVPAEYGMEIMAGYLFVIDGSTIRGIELGTENQVMTLNIPGFNFLNGLTNDGVSTLYATAFLGKKIYKIDVSDIANPSYEVIVEDTGSTPNGIVFDGTNNRLIFVSWGNNATIKAVDLTDNSVSTIVTTSVGNIDGIDEDNDGNYYISYWSPSKIAKYDNAFANPPEVISTPFLENPADICYAKEIDTLAIPHSGNIVTFVGFNSDTISSTQDIFSNDFELEVFPNPVTENSIIQFSLDKKIKLQLSIFNKEGKIIKTLLQGEQMKGRYSLSFAGISIEPGIYWLSLEGINVKKTIPIQVN